MNKTILKNEWLVFIGLVTLILVSRLSSHVWNFTAVGGVALFSGAYFSKKYFAVLVPLVGLIISDLIIGLHDQMFSVYFSYAVIVAIGFGLTVQSSRTKTALFSFTGAILFFLITNFDSWLGSAFYQQNLDGLLTSYTLGLPFFRSQLASDLISSLVIFECAKQLARLTQAATVSETKN